MAVRDSHIAEKPNHINRLILKMNSTLTFTIVLATGILLSRIFDNLIYRLPRKLPIFKFTGNCVQCETRIPFLHRIPIVSYFISGGKCQICGSRHLLNSFLVELSTGILITVAFIYYGFSFKGFEVAILSSILIILFFININFMILPDIIILPGIIIGLVLSIFPSAFAGWQSSIVGAFLGGTTTYVFSKIGLFLFKKEALGIGTIKIMTMLGAFLGWQYVILIFVIAIPWSLVLGTALLALRREWSKSLYLPSCLIGAIPTLVVVYFGGNIIKIILSLING